MLFPESATKLIVPELLEFRSEKQSVNALFNDYGYKMHEPPTPVNSAEFVKEFCRAWRNNDNQSTVQPVEVFDMMARRNRDLERAWTQYLPGDHPSVIITSVVGRANPFIIRNANLSPLIVMSEGLSGFVFGMVMTFMLYAHDRLEPEIALSAMRRFMLAWLTNDPVHTPSGTEIHRFSTIDQEITTFAVGIANCVMTWAYFHELGHLRHGHLNHTTQMIQSASNTNVIAEAHSYSHANEYEADCTGLDMHLDLLRFENELRKDFEIGKQADHAPLMGFELMDIAYQTFPAYDHRISSSHPPPLARSRALHNCGAQRFCEEGVAFYSYWCDLLAYVKTGLQLN